MMAQLLGVQIWVFLVFACTLAFARELTEYTTCGGKVLFVDAEPCETVPCKIPRGSSATITVRCLPDVDSDKLRLNIYANIQGIELPYPGLKRDACQGKNVTCPITKGKEIQYVQKFNVKTFFPKIQTVAKFTLVTNDKQDATVCCVQIPVEVTEKLN